MKNLKKLVTIVLSLAVLTLLTACSQAAKLADCFEKDTVKQQAMDDITLAQSGDYEAWKARFAPELQTALTKESYNSYLAVLEEKGAFKEFGKIALAGQQQNKEDYAIAIVMTKWESGTLKYTIAYDKNMKLISFTI